MIYIEKNVTNRVCLTLSETASLASPFFLFVFTRELNPDATPFFWQPEDQSSFPARYNLFNLIESDFNFPTGQYKYEVYEAELSTTDISQTTGNVIETGKMVVELKDEINSIYD